MLERKIDKYLQNWLENKKNRKPLIIKGARQVGKTTTIKSFANSNFKAKKIMYLDLQNNNLAYQYLSDENIDTDIFINALKTIFNMNVDDSCILIIDEIQRLPHLETLLKPLHEQYSWLPIIAAGSLVDLILHNATNSKPVGKVQTIYMYPLDFEEFCLNTGESYCLNLIKKHIIKDKFNTTNYHLGPINAITHDKMNRHYYNYIVVGGMPEAVVKFSENKIDYFEIKKNLLEDYRKDISKFFDNKEVIKIRSIYDSIYKQLIKSNTRFNFKELQLEGIKKVDRYSRVASPIDTLILSNMVGKVNYLYSNYILTT